MTKVLLSKDNAVEVLCCIYLLVRIICCPILLFSMLHTGDACVIYYKIVVSYFGDGVTYEVCLVATCHDVSNSRTCNCPHIVWFVFPFYLFFSKLLDFIVWLQMYLTRSIGIGSSYQ